MKGLQPGKTLCFQKYSWPPSFALSRLLKTETLVICRSQQKYDKATLVINMEMNFQYVEMLEALQHNGSHQFLAEKNVQKLNWMVILKLTFLKKYRATKDSMIFFSICLMVLIHSIIL